MTSYCQENDCYLYRSTLAGSGEQWYLLMADVHYDSLHCDRSLLSKHLRQAKERNAMILVFGDLFDCMAGRFDMRSNKGDVRPEYVGDNYYNRVVDDAVGYFSTVSDLMTFVSIGNHEHAVTRFHEIDVLSMFNQGMGGKIMLGKYDGFVRFQFHKSLKTDHSGCITSKVLYYTHGAGGNSPVTKGVIGTNRRQVNIHADYFVSGHLHSEWEVPLTRVRLNNDNNIVVEKVRHWQLGTYLNSRGNVFDAKHGFAAPTLGARWLHFKFVNNELITESFIAE